MKQSDKVIITSDNPRFEEPQDIINDMLAGLNAQQMRKVLTIVDRKEAIRTACMMAQKGDVVLIAGKGHEDYQDIKGVKHHFDDHEVVRECFCAPCWWQVLLFFSFFLSASLLLNYSILNWITQCSLTHK